MPRLQTVNFNPPEQANGLESIVSQFSQGLVEQRQQSRESDALEDIYKQYQSDGQNLDNLLMNVNKDKRLGPTAKANLAGQALKLKEMNTTLQKEAVKAANDEKKEAYKTAALKERELTKLEAKEKEIAYMTARDKAQLNNDLTLKERELTLRSALEDKKLKNEQELAKAKHNLELALQDKKTSSAEKIEKLKQEYVEAIQKAKQDFELSYQEKEAAIKNATLEKTQSHQSELERLKEEWRVAREKEILGLKNDFTMSLTDKEALIDKEMKMKQQEYEIEIERLKEELRLNRERNIETLKIEGAEGKKRKVSEFLKTIQGKNLSSQEILQAGAEFGLDHNVAKDLAANQEAMNKKVQEEEKAARARQEVKALLIAAGDSEEDAEYKSQFTSAQTARNQLKESSKKEPRSEFKKITERKEAEELHKLRSEIIPKAKDALSNLDRIQQLSKTELKGLEGYIKGVINTESAAEMENLGFTAIEPIIKLFNPVGPIPVAKMTIIRNVFQPHAKDLQTTIDGKVAALRRIGQQALLRAQTRADLIEKYDGTPPKGELENFDDNSKNLQDTLVDQEAFKLLKSKKDGEMISGLYSKKDGKKLGPVSVKKAKEWIDKGLVTYVPR